MEGQANRGLADARVSWAGGSAAIKVQIARMSPFHLEAPIETRDGLPVASFRDVVAGKLHALCDRTVVRDVIDLHAILRRPSIPGDRRERPGSATSRSPPGCSPLHCRRSLGERSWSRTLSACASDCPRAARGEYFAIPSALADASGRYRPSRDVLTTSHCMRSRPE